MLSALLNGLFALAFWLVAAWAAVGALLVLGFVWCLARNWWDEQTERAASRDLAPFDQDDPLERQFALPAATRRVR